MDPMVSGLVVLYSFLLDSTVWYLVAILYYKELRFSALWFCFSSQRFRLTTVNNLLRLISSRMPPTSMGFFLLGILFLKPELNTGGIISIKRLQIFFHLIHIFNFSLSFLRTCVKIFTYLIFLIKKPCLLVSCIIICYLEICFCKIHSTINKVIKTVNLYKTYSVV